MKLIASKRVRIKETQLRALLNEQRMLDFLDPDSYFLLATPENTKNILYTFLELQENISKFSIFSKLADGLTTVTQSPILHYPPNY